VSLTICLQAFVDRNGPTAKSAAQRNTYRPCPFETYPASHVLFTMDSVAFPKSIFNEWAADFSRRACRTGESITMSSKARTWTGFRSGINRIALLFAVTALVCVGQASATTYYIAANGSDANNGTTKTTPWLHAPGMPNCAGTCASHTPAPGDSFIFRGGDTWHFGNSGLSPYTGGTWNWPQPGSAANCVYEGSESSCIYIGVDQTWFTGGSWSRPILNADNPVSTSTVSSCAYQVGTKNQIWAAGGSGYLIFDNFEMVGLCQPPGNVPCCGYDAYISDSIGCGTCMNTYSNLYIHGWTDQTGVTQEGCTAFETSNGGEYAVVGNVVDGSDSWAPGCYLWTTGYLTHMKNNIFRHVASQMEGGGCHDIHDNIWEYFIHGFDNTAHNNVIECNSDMAGSTPNVFYNNIFRHDDSGLGATVHIWFDPNTTAAEYWFNNVVYDVTDGNNWDVDTSAGGVNSGPGIFMFNNTLESANYPGFAPCVGTKMVVSNQHMISENGSNVWGGGGNCGSSSPSNIVMTHATANTQGYTSTSATVTSGQPTSTCANDTTPCAPTASGNSTVTAGTNDKSYCTTLASYSSDPSISTDAANACQYDTTAACSYNQTNHTAVCPARVADARPVNGAWDTGAYEFNANDPPPNPPTNLTDVVN